MNSPAPMPRSNFVTGLAWVMIAFGAFGILMSLMQNILFSVLLPAFEGTAALPGLLGAFPLGFLRVAMLFSLALAAFMTYAAWALLKRRNWARILFIVMFIISVVTHVIVVVAIAVGASLMGAPPVGDEFMPPEVASMLRALSVAFAVFMLAMAVGYAWLAYRLCSPAIAAEFKEPGAAV